jgi:hypothetical protein
MCSENQGAFNYFNVLTVLCIHKGLLYCAIDLGSFDAASILRFCAIEYRGRYAGDHCFTEG